MHLVVPHTIDYTSYEQQHEVNPLLHSGHNSVRMAKISILK